MILCRMSIFRGWNWEEEEKEEEKEKKSVHIHVLRTRFNLCAATENDGTPQSVHYSLMISIVYLFIYDECIRMVFVLI